MRQVGLEGDALVRGDKLTASKIYHDKVLNHPKIDVRFKVSVKRFVGTKHLEGLVVETSGGEETLRPAAVFVFIGLKPNTRFLEGRVALTADGFIDAPSLATSLQGLFAPATRARARPSRSRRPWAKGPPPPLRRGIISRRSVRRDVQVEAMPV